MKTRVTKMQLSTMKTIRRKVTAEKIETNNVGPKTQLKGFVINF